MTRERRHISRLGADADEVDVYVGTRRGSHFMLKAANPDNELREILRALNAAFGTWRVSDHPGFERGVDRWVRQWRRSQERSR